MRTVEEAKAWGRFHEAECLKTYAACKDVPDSLRSPRLEAVWVSGCWLKEALLSAGANDEQWQRIGFCHGQRCMRQDPWATAVAYANEFESNGAVRDQPGYELAMEINRGNFGT